MKGNSSEKKELTAAMDGLLSSPACGCVTSAPMMIVGRSLTRGILLKMASFKTVFLPPTLTLILRDRFSRYCLFSFCACLGLQHWETHPSKIERVLRDIHKQSVQRLNEMGQSSKHLQLLIIILPDVKGSYGEELTVTQNCAFYLRPCT